MPRLNVPVKALAKNKDTTAMYKALKSGDKAFRQQFRAGMAMCIG